MKTPSLPLASNTFRRSGPLSFFKLMDGILGPGFVLSTFVRSQQSPTSLSFRCKINDVQLQSSLGRSEQHQCLPWGDGEEVVFPEPCRFGRSDIGGWWEVDLRTAANAREPAHKLRRDVVLLRSKR